MSCQECDRTIPPRIEHIVVPKLCKLINHEPSATDDILLGGSECKTEQKRRRPDTLWIWKDRVVSVEIDENGGHPDRISECEIDKMQSQAFSIYTKLGNRIVPVYYLRFNPDESNCSTPLETRILRVADRVNKLLSMKLPGDEAELCKIFVEYYYYHTKCFKHIEAARKVSCSMCITHVQ